MLTLEEIKAKVDEIDTLRQKFNAFIVECIKDGAFTDGLKLAAQISALVASGGTDPAAALTALGTLTQINVDLTTAKNAVEAQTATA